MSDGLEAQQEQSEAAAPNLRNAVQAMEKRGLPGAVWFDAFYQRVLTDCSWNGEPVSAREWTDADDLHLAIWLQERGGLPRITTQTAAQAAQVFADRNRRNAVQAEMKSLGDKWDGVTRIEEFLNKAFGVADTEFARAASRNFLISLVARPLRPGVKADAMLVLEGIQGLGKSQACQILAGENHFAEASENPTSKDFFIGLQGKLLIEIGELDVFSRTEVTAVKRVLSCQVDRYRPPYGRAAKDFPRQCVFIGTTNRSDWSKDDTGARRFWPVRCSTVDLEYIRRARDQLLAEAVAKFTAGATWWEMPAEATAAEQEDRRQGDPWEEIIRSWLLMRVDTTANEILRDCLEIDAARQDRAAMMRVANVLRLLGWEKFQKGTDRKKAWRRVAQVSHLPARATQTNKVAHPETLNQQGLELPHLPHPLSNKINTPIAYRGIGPASEVDLSAQVDQVARIHCEPLDFSEAPG